MSMVAGYQMQSIAQGYLVYEMTRSAKILGLVSGMAAVPVLCLALIGGAFADRVPPKRLIQLGQMCSMGLALFVAFSIITESVTWVHLAAAALMQGVAWSFMGPARQAMLPHLLPRNRIANGIALISAGMSAPALVAPAAAGLLYAVVGPEGVYVVVAGLGLIAVALSTSIRADTKPEGGPRGSVASDIAQGVSYIWNKEVVRLLLLIGFGFVFFSAPLQSLLPVLIVEVYQLESEALGLLVSMSGVGALVGTVIIAGLREGRRGKLFVGAGDADGGRDGGCRTHSNLRAGRCGDRRRGTGHRRGMVAQPDTDNGADRRPLPRPGDEHIHDELRPDAVRGPPGRDHRRHRRAPAGAGGTWRANRRVLGSGPREGTAAQGSAIEGECGCPSTQLLNWQLGRGDQFVIGGVGNQPKHLERGSADKVLVLFAKYNAARSFSAFNRQARLSNRE